ncbi:MAG: LuxR C-terminal-related transcriptional regulator [Caldilineaceae bacterium]
MTARPDLSFVRAAASPRTLTRREREILLHLATGSPYKTVARNLGIAQATVKTHAATVRLKLDVASNIEAVVLALRCGLITLDEVVPRG